MEAGRWTEQLSIRLFNHHSMKSPSKFWLGFLVLLVVIGATIAATYPSFTGSAVTTGTLTFGTNLVQAVYNVQNFGALGNGQPANNVTTTSNSTTVGRGDGTNWSTNNIGQVLRIGQAGPGGINDLTVTISAVNGTNCTVSAVASSTQTNTFAIVGTDDTAAIQAALNQITNGSCTVFFPNGNYIVNGPLQNVTGDLTTGHNSQLYLPPISGAANSTALPQLTIAGVGLIGQAYGIPPGSSNFCALYGSTICSTLITNRVGHVFDCQNFISPYYSAGTVYTVSANCVRVQLDGINLICPNNPCLEGWDLEGASEAGARSCLIGTGQGEYTIVYPTNGLFCSGLRLPSSNNQGDNHVSDVCIEGFPVGLAFSEHTFQDGELQLFSCVYGMVQTNGGGHYFNFEGVNLQNVKCGVLVTTAGINLCSGFFRLSFENSFTNSPFWPTTNALMAGGGYSWYGQAFIRGGNTPATNSLGTNDGFIPYTAQYGMVSYTGPNVNTEIVGSGYFISTSNNVLWDHLNGQQINGSPPNGGNVYAVMVNNTNTGNAAGMELQTTYTHWTWQTPFRSGNNDDITWRDASGNSWLSMRPTDGYAEMVSGPFVGDKGLGSRATNYGAAIYNSSTHAITNALTNQSIQLNLTITSGNVTIYNGAGTAVSTNSALTGTITPILQPGGYLTYTTNAAAINGAWAL